MVRRVASRTRTTASAAIAMSSALRGSAVGKRLLTYSYRTNR